MKDLRIIFIHGNGGNSWSYCWTPWLKKELINLGFDVVFETFPDSVLARKSVWMPYMKEELKIDENTLLIGHSSGAVAAMRYAEENKIFGSILISPCYTDLGFEDEKISGWYDEPWFWEKIRENQKFIVLFYSENDEVIPLNEFEYIKDKLNVDEVMRFEDKGHFIKQDTFPEVVEYIKRLK